MRPVLFCDVSTTARALLNVAPSHRQEICDQILFETQVADRFTRKIGRCHPDFGDGTLAARAHKLPLSQEPTLDQISYCACLIMVLEGLIRKRQEGAAHQ